jgi:hypothetical protein
MIIMIMLWEAPQSAEPIKKTLMENRKVTLRPKMSLPFPYLSVDVKQHAL